MDDVPRKSETKKRRRKKREEGGRLRRQRSKTFDEAVDLPSRAPSKEVPANFKFDAVRLGAASEASTVLANSGPLERRQQPALRSTTTGSPAVGFLSMIPSEFHAPRPAMSITHREMSDGRQKQGQEDSKRLTVGFLSTKVAVVVNEDDLQPASGEFEPQMAADGWLLKRTKGSKWKKVYCRLTFAGLLKEYKEEDADSPKTVTKLKEVRIAKDALTERGIRVRHKSKTVTYQAPTTESYAMWLPSLAQYTHEMFTALDVNSLSFPAMVCNTRGLIVRVNREAERLLGYAAKELMGGGLAGMVATQQDNANNEALLACLSSPKAKGVTAANRLIHLTHLSGEPLPLTMDLGMFNEAAHGDKYILAFKLASSKKRLDLDAARGVMIKWLTAEEGGGTKDEFMKSQVKLSKFFGD